MPAQVLINFSAAFKGLFADLRLIRKHFKLPGLLSNQARVDDILHYIDQSLASKSNAVSLNELSDFAAGLQSNLRRLLDRLELWSEDYGLAAYADDDYSQAAYADAVLRVVEYDDILQRYLEIS